MSKYIILYRHGMPKDKATAPNDDLRELSIRGRRLINRSIFGFKKMLGIKKQIKIYSSPRLRARQTAELLASELSVERPQYFEFLATGGNIKLLKQIIEQVEPRTVAIIIGHQPFLSVWSQELSGSYLPFKKGTAACFKFQDQETDRAELRWYLQTRDFIKIE